MDANATTRSLVGGNLLAKYSGIIPDLTLRCDHRDSAAIVPPYLIAVAKNSCHARQLLVVSKCSTPVTQKLTRRKDFRSSICVKSASQRRLRRVNIRDDKLA
jgi:hypothetical protein